MIGSLYILTGPSGVGKTSVAMELLRLRPNLKKVVTCTTRPMRNGEVDGVSYHFLDHATFQTLIDAHQMFEWDRHYDHYYGSRTSDVEQLMQQGHDVLFVVDVKGAKTIKAEHPTAVLLFLEPENEDQLLERIKRRDGESTSGLENRLASIREELAFAPTADHQIVNKEGKLQETIEIILEIMDA